MPKHHDRRRNAVQWTKEPRPNGGRQIACFGASEALTGGDIAQSGVWHLNQAATRSTSVTSTPSLNFTPVITLVK